MLDKIEKYRKHPIVQQLRDVRVLGLLLFGVIVLLVSWSGVQAIQTNYELQKQIAKLEQEAKVGELENNNLKLRNQYYNTDQYLELQARRQFGKAAPGEKLLLVPKNVALAHTSEPPTATAAPIAPKPHKPTYQQNFEAWINFLFHRQPDAG
jgi:cell division protein FtsB